MRTLFLFLCLLPIGGTGGVAEAAKGPAIIYFQDGRTERVERVEWICLQKKVDSQYRYCHENREGDKLFLTYKGENRWVDISNLKSIQVLNGYAISPKYFFDELKGYYVEGTLRLTFNNNVATDTFYDMIEWVDVNVQDELSGKREAQSFPFVKDGKLNIRRIEFGD
jgi:hypothetical protein